MTKITFRQIQKKDFQAIHDLALKGWRFAYRHLMEKDVKKLVDRYYSHKSLERSLSSAKKRTGFFVLAFEKNKLLGFCSVGIRKKRAELYRIYIEPKRIGKGLGKKLLLLAERFLKRKTPKKYFTFVNKQNAIGIGFYLRNGFKQIPSKDKDDEFEPKALLYMEKNLDA